MFSTKNLVLKPADIPSYWVFQYYLNLSERLIGQDIKIKSVFNPSERNTKFLCLCRQRVYAIQVQRFFYW